MTTFTAISLAANWAVGGYSATPEITCTIISTGGIILSALISYWASRFAASNEIKQMKALWDREDSETVDKLFLEMISEVEKFICEELFDNIPETLSAISKARAYMPSNLAPLGDQLHKDVQGEDRSAARKTLDKIIAEKRSTIHIKHDGKKHG